MAHAPAHYDIVYVSRAPQAATGPILAEVGPVVGDVSWTEDLYQPDTIEVTAPTNKIEDDLKLRLRDLVTYPTEIWVYRNGNKIAVGSLLGGSIDDDKITLSASGLLTYLQYMFITGDKTYSGIDQALIIKEIIDDWQALSYGDFGIDTSAVTAHSQLRTISYVGAEYPNVFDVAMELGEADNGYNIWIDPANRELQLSHPTRGVDKSATVFLERGIANPNIKFSVAPGVIASESFGAAKNEGGTPITTTQTNTDLRESFGRVGHAESYGDADQTLLDDKALASLDVRSSMLFQPGPGLIPVDGAGVEDFSPGDLVSYLYDAGIGQQQGIYRVRSKKVSVDDGKEMIEVQFE
jgi:hypothetical protein